MADKTQTGDESTADEDMATDLSQLAENANEVTPILIAGGGPVGMTLALELARYGVASILVERNPTTTRHPKMDLTNGRSMELFKRLGLESKLRDVGVPRENPFDISWITSLSGHELYRFKYPSANEKREHIHARNDGSQASEPGLRVSQIVIEPVLKVAIDENPLIDVRFNTAFERVLENGPDGVLSEVLDRDSGKTYKIASAYLAGCDGGGSRVREEVGIKLEGEFNIASAYMVHFRSEARDILQRWGVTWHYQSGSGTVIAQNDDDIYTLQRWIMPGDNPDEMRPEDVLEEWVGQPFEYEILQANPWSAHLVLAERFVNGRVALAGDSAHQLIPTGGYGMNSGIGDAIGLAWVLAAGVRGWAGPNLLDAYGEERREAGIWFQAGSRAHMEVRIQISQLYAAAGALEGDDPDVPANRTRLAKQLEDVGNAENESWGIELGYRYDASPAIIHESNAPEVDRLTYTPSTYPGARLPHVFLDDGGPGIHDVLGDYFTLVAFKEADFSSLGAAARDHGIPLKVLTLERPDLEPIYETDFLLVRPDQHIAWRGDALPANAAEILATVTGH